MNKLSHIPEEKEIRPISFIFRRTDVKISNLISEIPVAKELFKETVKLDLHPTGRIHWHCIGLTRIPSKPFVLEICLPIANGPNEYDGAFHFKRTENLKSISLVHEVSWSEIQSYEILIKYAQQQDYQANGVTRELYINGDLTDPVANVTEIQLGIN